MILNGKVNVNIYVYVVLEIYLEIKIICSMED